MCGCKNGCELVGKRKEKELKTSEVFRVERKSWKIITLLKPNTKDL